MRVTPVPLPDWSSLAPAAAAPGAYADCFACDLPGQVALVAYVAAFYDTPLFRLERAVLQLLLRRRIGVAETSALAEGRSDRFAVWRVAQRDDRQILLRQTGGHTMSWLAVVPDGAGTTRLLFGSQVAARRGHLPPVLRLCLPVHRLYARALLRAAARRLAARRGGALCGGGQKC
ncbi:hypothetical protein [Jannaschia marina]|uniref:hypothetical protein n=1 Tax=Jannaschia marina TaxID=2741674 RepID=UPI0015CE0930|nr:hypothetical protein [Jannaschia marina]